MAAAAEAAACMSLGDELAGLGRIVASSGKLRWAERPLMASAATSCARAAISGVWKVPSQILDFFLGSRISDTHFPHCRIRTPRYVGCSLLAADLAFLVLAGSVGSLSVSNVVGDEEMLLLRLVSSSASISRESERLAEEEQDSDTFI